MAFDSATVRRASTSARAFRARNCDQHFPHSPASSNEDGRRAVPLSSEPLLACDALLPTRGSPRGTCAVPLSSVSFCWLTFVGSVGFAGATTRTAGDAEANAAGGKIIGVARGSGGKVNRPSSGIEAEPRDPPEIALSQRATDSRPDAWSTACGAQLFGEP